MGNHYSDNYENEAEERQAKRDEKLANLLAQIPENKRGILESHKQKVEENAPVLNYVQALKGGDARESLEMGMLAAMLVADAPVERSLPTVTASPSVH